MEPLLVWLISCQMYLDRADRVPSKARLCSRMFQIILISTVCFVVMQLYCTIFFNTYIFFYLVNRVFVPCGASPIHWSPLPHCPPSFSLRFGNCCILNTKRKKKLGAGWRGGWSGFFSFSKKCLVLKISSWEFPWWLSRLRIWHCLYEDSGSNPDLAQWVKDSVLPWAVV